MNNISINLRPIPRTTKLLKKDAEMLENYLSYIELNKLRFVVHIIENTNPNISISNLEYIYGLSSNYVHSEIVLSNLKSRDLLKYEPIIINSLAIDPIDVFLEELNKLSDREQEILLSRASKLTLEEIGNSQNVTRERIRQIEKKSFEKLYKVLEDIFVHYGKTEGYIDLEELSEKLNEVELKIVNYLFDYHDMFQPDELTGKIVIKTDAYKQLNENIKSLLEYNLINNNDIESFIEEQKDMEVHYIEVEDVSSYLSLNKFKFVDDMWINMRLIATPYIYIIKKYFPLGIELKQNFATDDFVELVNITNEVFGLRRSTNGVRTLTVRIREQLVAVDRSIYVTEDRFKYDINLINNILEELSNSKIKNTFYFAEILEIYKRKLIKGGIHNRYALASAINRTPYTKYTDRDKLTFSNAKEQSFNQLLNKYILECGNVVTMKELRKEFIHFPELMIYQNLHENAEIIDWGHAKYIHVSNIPKISEFRTNEIDKIFENNEYIVFDKFIKLFTKNNNIVEYGISRNYDINKLFENIFPDKYIYCDGFIWERKFKSLDIIQRLFIYLDKDENSIISIDEVKNFASNNRLSYDSTRSLIRALEGNFIRKNKKEYYPFSTKINNLHLINLKNEIIDLIYNEDIVTVEKVYNECHLPTNDILWTKETVVNVVRNKLDMSISFHPIGVDKLLSSQGLFSLKDKDNLLDIIFGYFNEIGLNKVDEKDLENFMIDNKISSFGIPREFYQSEYYFKKEERFNF